MADLSDYPVSFPYGATSSPYSENNPHHGDDRAAPSGTPIIVSGKTIGKVGSTGYSSGPHCHIDKNRGLWQNAGAYVRPTNYFSLKGEVVFASNAGTAGNCVVIQTDDDWFYRYLHMSSINCKVGDKIGGVMKIGRETAIRYLRIRLRKNPTEAQIVKYANYDLPQFNKAMADYRASAEFQTVVSRVNNYPTLAAENARLKAELANGDEANLLGRAIIPVLAKLGYKKQ